MILFSKKKFSGLTLFFYTYQANANEKQNKNFHVILCLKHCIMPKRRELYALSARHALKMTAFDDRSNAKTSIGIPTSTGTYLKFNHKQ